MNPLGYILTLNLTPEATQPAIDKLDGWEGTKYLTATSIDPETGRAGTLWHVPNPTVAAGIILTCGSWYDDLVWGDYSIVENKVVTR